MAPKPASAKAPKKPTASAKSAKDTSKAEPVEKSDENETKFAPTNKEEALAQISFDGLPNCPIEQITDMFKDKYEVLVKVFAHYCKFSDCVTVEKATRLRLGMPEQACAAARARTCGCVRRGGLCSPAYAHRPRGLRPRSGRAMRERRWLAGGPHLRLEPMHTRTGGVARRVWTSACVPLHGARHRPTPDALPRERIPSARASFAAGFKRLVKDAALELKVYDINQQSRLFNLKGGAKVLRRPQRAPACPDEPGGRWGVWGGEVGARQRPQGAD